VEKRALLRFVANIFLVLLVAAAGIFSYRYVQSDRNLRAITSEMGESKRALAELGRLEQEARVMASGLLETLGAKQRELELAEGRIASIEEQLRRSSEREAKDRGRIESLERGLAESDRIREALDGAITESLGETGRNGEIIHDLGIELSKIRRLYQETEKGH